MKKILYILPRPVRREFDFTQYVKKYILAWMVKPDVLNKDIDETIEEAIDKYDDHP